MSTLFVVATPVGNLQDITLRALQTLKKVDFIAAEDTRRTLKLLDHFEIKKPLISYHQHSGRGKIDLLIKRLKDGENGALVSDAGTPGVADPGGMLVEAMVKADINVIPIPGACTIPMILSVTGWPTDKFIFIGFLPKKKGRQKQLGQLKNESRPIVLFESPYRLAATLKEIYNLIGDCEVVIGREMTKIYEEFIRGTLKDVIDNLPKIKIKGEFVICLRKK